MFSTSVILAQPISKVTNQTVDILDNPGSLNEMLLRISQDTPVVVDDIDGYWEKIRLNDITGWVPGYTLSIASSTNSNSNNETARSQRDEIFSQLNSMNNRSEVSTSASPAQVAAAVKGFFEKYRNSKELEFTVNLDDYTMRSITSFELYNFKKSRIKPERLNRSEDYLYPAEPYSARDITSLEQVGYSLASVLAQDGLVSDRNAQRYLQRVTAQIVEISHRPELRPKIFMLSTEEVVGYSLPGNYLFISVGAIKAMQNEAQLVHFMAHEIAHLIFGHGMNELDNREVKINAENAFTEMRQTVRGSSQMTEFEQRLTEMADEFYDYINKDRLESYETEADYWATIYTYLAGYNPYSVRDYLKNIYQNNTVGLGEWNGITIEKRLFNLNSMYSNFNFETTPPIQYEDFDWLKGRF